MAFLNWSESYSVGIEKIDRQHKKIVSFLNELFEAMQTGQGKDVLGKVLADLVIYTKTHFATEEQLMAQADFPDFRKHKEIHEKMAAKVLDLNQQYRDGVVNSPIQITKFLKKWLTSHISETDKKYGPFLASKGIN
jgi:hemerythrin